MREKEEQREMKKYRFSLIRIRFPDGVLLQVTRTFYFAMFFIFVQCILLCITLKKVPRNWFYMETGNILITLHESWVILFFCLLAINILTSRGQLLFYSKMKKHTANLENRIVIQNFKRIYRKVKRRTCSVRDSQWQDTLFQSNFKLRAQKNFVLFQ